jgi:hypothetical protein
LVKELETLRYRWAYRVVNLPGAYDDHFHQHVESVVVAVTSGLNPRARHRKCVAGDEHATRPRAGPRDAQKLALFVSCSPTIRVREMETSGCFRLF